MQKSLLFRLRRIDLSRTTLIFALLDFITIVMLIPTLLPTTNPTQKLHQPCLLVLFLPHRQHILPRLPIPLALTPHHQFPHLRGHSDTTITDSKLVQFILHELLFVLFVIVGPGQFAADVTVQQAFRVVAGAEDLGGSRLGGIEEGVEKRVEERAVWVRVCSGVVLDEGLVEGGSQPIGPACQAQVVIQCLQQSPRLFLFGLLAFSTSHILICSHFHLVTRLPYFIPISVQALLSPSNLHSMPPALLISHVQIQYILNAVEAGIVDGL